MNKNRLLKCSPIKILFHVKTYLGIVKQELSEIMSQGCRKGICNMFGNHPHIKHGATDLTLTRLQLHQFTIFEQNITVHNVLR